MYNNQQTVGTFGRVLECWDREREEYVAIKVIRSKSKYREAAMIEIDVLDRLSSNKDCRSQCVCSSLLFFF
jgi:dual-specificity kinase